MIARLAAPIAARVVTPKRRATLSRHFRRTSNTIAIVGVAATIAAVAAQAKGIYLNVSGSIPKGIYRQTSERIVKDGYVLFCPPGQAAFADALKRGYLGRGDCPGGSYPMSKRLAGVPGDRFDIGADGVRINGHLVPQSAPRELDGAGRTLPFLRTSGTLPSGSIIVMGENDGASFDSRYFGPIPAALITGPIHPVVTW